MQAARSSKAITTLTVREELAALQVAVRAMLADLPGLAGSRPVDIMNAVSIDLKLAWKLARIAQSGDPFATVRHLPGAAGWRIATAAIATAGARAEVVAAASTAFDRAIATGTAWAGDRKAFDIMAAGVAAGSDLRIDVEHRRELYRGGSYVWGVRAQLAVRADILGPARKKRMLDCVTMRGFVGVERMRSDAAWQIEAPFVVDDRGTKPVRAGIEPLEESTRTTRGAGAAGPHLLTDFCSGALPEMRAVAEKGSPRRLELADSAVGAEGRFTVFHGSVLRDVQPVQRSQQHHGIFQLWKHRTPAERAVFDLAVHRSVIEDDSAAEAILYSDLNLRAGTFHHRSKDRIPAGLAVENLGVKLRRARLDGFDQHVDLLMLGFTRMGWDPADFVLFRTDAPYPPIPSTLVLELPLKD